ncbi:MAG: hypothetical protein WD055_01420 [Candidatus Dependentiae bacterium]
MKSLYICLTISCSLYASDKEGAPKRLTHADGGILLAYDMALGQLQLLNLGKKNEHATQELKKLIHSIVDINATTCKATFATLRQQQQAIAKLQEQNNQLSNRVEELTQKEKNPHARLKNNSNV